MKQTTLTLFLAAFVIMLTTPFAVSPHFKTKPATTQISYYWFNSSNVWLGRQNTLANEIALTGYDESIQNPKTIQEKGWSSVTFDQWGNPIPLGSTPAKTLYSHP
jgi:hypothetical protein